MCRMQMRVGFRWNRIHIYHSHRKALGTNFRCNTTAFNFNKTMAITISKTEKPSGKSFQNIWIVVEADGDKCNFVHTAPADLEGDDLQAYVDGREDFYKREVLRNMYPTADCYNADLETFEKWIAAGCKLEEISEERITQAAVPAADAVMGERQVVVESEEESEVSTTEIVEVDGKFVEKTTTETVTNTVSTPQVTKHKLYNDAGEEIGEHEVPVMESYEVSPAVEAVEEKSETVITRAESVVEKVAWKDTAE